MTQCGSQQTVPGSQPRHLLLQTYPQGHPECLKGKRFVISGTLDSLFRHEATDLIQKHSGRVTGSVSGSTSFLLCGENTATPSTTRSAPAS